MRENIFRFIRGAVIVSLVSLVSGCMLDRLKNDIERSSSNQEKGGLLPPKPIDSGSFDDDKPYPTYNTKPLVDRSIQSKDLSPLNSEIEVNSGGSLPKNQKKSSSSIFSQSAVDFDSMEQSDKQETVSLTPPNVFSVKEFEGWSSDGGSVIKTRQGDTLEILSQRYAIPHNVLKTINGIKTSSSLKKGQEIIIPVYLNRDFEKEKKAKKEKPDSKKNFENQVSHSLSSRVKEKKEQKSKGEIKTQPLLEEGKQTITIKQGDTLFSIARQAGISVNALKAANNNLKSNNLRVGRTLILPVKKSTNELPQTAKKESSSSLPSLEKKNQTHQALSSEPSKEKGLEKNNASVEPSAQDIEKPKENNIRLRWPVRGRIISEYGKGKGNARDGIDIQVPQGTPIRASESGTVIYAGDGLKDFGSTVLIRHENGLVTVYGHANELHVKRGQKIQRGEQIGVSGMSGASDSPRLHFEIRKNSVPINPTDYLE